MVSSEEETAHAISQSIGVPAAKQTDVFADGQVQIVELDVDPHRAARRSACRCARRACRPTRGSSRSSAATGRSCREAPSGSSRATASSSSARRAPCGSGARSWLSSRRGACANVVILGAGRAGVAIARLLLAQGISVRLVEADAARARDVADLLPGARVLNAIGTEPEFLEHERIHLADAAVLAMRDDAKNLYAGVLLERRGAPLIIGIAREATALAGLRDGRDRRRRRPAAADRRGNHPLRARPTHAPGGDVRGRPVRGRSTSSSARTASSWASRSGVLPMTGVRHRRDRPRRQGRLPARRRPAHARRPGHPLHGVEAGVAGRGRALTAVRARRRPRGSRSTSAPPSTSSAACWPCSGSHSWRQRRSRSATGSRPGRSCSPVWRRAAPVSCSRSPHGARPGSASARASSSSRSSGCSPRPRACCPTSSPTSPSSTSPIDAYFESMSGFSGTSATVVADVDALNSSLTMWRQLTAVVRRPGHHRALAWPCCRGCASAAGSSSSLDVAGPEIEPLAVTIRRRRGASRPLRGADGARGRSCSSALGWLGVGRMRWAPFEAIAHSFAHDLPTGGFATEPRSVEEFGRATQWTVDRVHGARRHQLRAHVPALIRGRFGALASRRGVPPLPLPARGAARSCCFVELAADGPRRAATSAVRHAIFQTVSIDDDHRLRERRLQRVDGPDERGPSSR